MRLRGMANAGKHSLTLIRSDGATIVLAPGESARIELDPRGQFRTVQRLHGLYRTIKGRL